MTLCYIDTETTGLDPRIHQPWEVCYWREGEREPTTVRLPHTLEHADLQALNIGRYWERCGAVDLRGNLGAPWMVAHALRGVTLVGSNPAFDAAMLTRVIGTAVWHHRMIDVSNVAMVVANVDRPMGLAEIREWLANSGYDIPEPDHTAEGDVRTTRAVYEALRKIGTTLSCADCEAAG